MSFRPVSTSWRRVLAALLLMLAVQRAVGADDFLEPDQAFKVSARALDPRTVEVVFAIAPGYYLYREQFRFVASGATLGSPVVPAGKIKFDETFQKNVETYHEGVRVAIPVAQASPEFRLVVTSQGCADAGLCYPPMQTGFRIGLTGFGGSGGVRSIPESELAAIDLAAPIVSTPERIGGTDLSPGDGSALGSMLRGGRFWPVVGAFFLAGLLLSLTPCVLPMLPIVSSIVAGHGVGVSRSRGLALAAAYSVGMAVVYTAFGVAAGLAGEGLAAALQTPWVLAVFALVLVALALSMFGAYELRLPAVFTHRMTEASQRLPAGRLAGVFAMGGVSALIVSPCIAAPLAGALVYLSQSRDVWLGGTALFSLAAGMSVPLLLIGASAGAILPRAGAWMDDVKRFFGLLLLGVALWTVQVLLAPSLVLVLWGALAFALAALLIAPLRSGGAPASDQRLWRAAIGASLAVVGVFQLVGAASGGTDPLQPLAPLARRAGGEEAAATPAFARVANNAQLAAALAGANRPVMVDFYADWCVSCKEMERYTFTDASVRQKLGNALLLKVDVTQNNVEDRALLKRFGLFGPPGTIFFDAHGSEIAGTRVIGFQNASRFLDTLRLAGL